MTMNHFKLMAMAALAALSLASCQKEEPVYTVVKKVKVTESDVLFGVEGGTGFITFEASGTASVSCKSEWCTVSLSGNKVTVNAPEYTGLEGRSAAINIACDKDTVRVTAQQAGMVFSYGGCQIDFKMAGGMEHIYGQCSFPEKIEADDWISYVKVSSGYVIEVGENTTGDNRKGTVKISAGSATATYVINQAFDRDFSGTYTVSYGGAEKGEVTLSRDASDENLYYIEGLVADAKIPFTYSASKNLLYIKNGQYVKQHTDGNYIYACVTYTNLEGSSSYYSVSTNANYDIWFSFAYSAGKYTISLYDSAKWFNKERTSTGFTMYTFTTEPGVTLATANKKATFLTCKHIGFVQK